MLTEKELDVILFTTSISQTTILNYMKSLSLLGAVQCMKEPTSPKNIKIADDIMNNIIDGYQIENHFIQ